MNESYINNNASIIVANNSSIQDSISFNNIYHIESYNMTSEIIDMRNITNFDPSRLVLNKNFWVQFGGGSGSNVSSVSLGTPTYSAPYLTVPIYAPTMGSGASVHWHAYIYALNFIEPK